MLEGGRIESSDVILTLKGYYNDTFKTVKGVQRVCFVSNSLTLAHLASNLI